MSDYYGVTRSDAYLAHYGVKGMKWGVRKAIQKGNNAKLAKHYKRAFRKLNRLNEKADINKQNIEASKYGKRALIGAGITGAGFGTHAALKRFKQKPIDNSGQAALNTLQESYIKPIKIKESTINEITIHENTIPETIIRESTIPNQANIIKSDINNANVSKHLKRSAKYAGLAVGIGYTGYAAARSGLAKYRTTKKGHAKSIAKRDAWRNQMRDVFAGTKYANLPDVQKKRHRKKSN